LDHHISGSISLLESHT